MLIWRQTREPVMVRIVLVGSWCESWTCCRSFCARPLKDSLDAHTYSPNIIRLSLSQHGFSSPSIIPFTNIHKSSPKKNIFCGTGLTKECLESQTHRPWAPTPPTPGPLGHVRGVLICMGRGTTIRFIAIVNIVLHLARP